MLAASDALKSFLASYGTTQGMRVDLFTLTLADGTVLRYHDAADPWPGAASGGRTDTITVGGNAFLRGPAIQRSALSVAIGTAVPTLDISVFPKNLDDSAGPTDTVKGAIWPVAARRRLFDGATMQLDTLVMPAWGDASLGAVTRFRGLIGEIEAGYSEVKLRCNADIVRLNQQMPRNLWQPSCNNSLYDAGCALAKASFAVAGYLTGVGSLVSVGGVAGGQPAGYFNLGTLEFTSGACNGSKRTIKTWDGLTFTLLRPLDVLPAPADTFNAFPGCDHSTGAGGCSKFSNLAHFRGTPFVPQPSTVL